MGLFVRKSVHAYKQILYAWQRIIEPIQYMGF